MFTKYTSRVRPVLHESGLEYFLNESSPKTFKKHLSLLLLLLYQMYIL